MEFKKLLKRSTSADDPEAGCSNKVVQAIHGLFFWWKNRPVRLKSDVSHTQSRG